MFDKCAPFAEVDIQEVIREGYSRDQAIEILQMIPEKPLALTQKEIDAFAELEAAEYREMERSNER